MKSLIKNVSTLGNFYQQSSRIFFCCQLTRMVIYQIFSGATPTNVTCDNCFGFNSCWLFKFAINSYQLLQKSWYVHKVNCINRKYMICCDIITYLCSKFFFCIILALVVQQQPFVILFLVSIPIFIDPLNL